MTTVGLLYSKEDAFSVKRSEMLLGTMIMEKVRFIRFLPEDIQQETLLVTGEEHRPCGWSKTEPLKLDAILDHSIPGKNRVSGESALLSATPHTHRIDNDRQELLELISAEPAFTDILLEMRALNSFSDLVEAEKQWGKVAIKAKKRSQQPTIYIASKEKNQWQICLPYERKHLSDSEMSNFVAEVLLGKYFLQKGVDSVSSDNQSIAFSLVIQQRFDGAWKTPNVRGVISTESPIASLKAGGEFIGTPLLKDDEQYLTFTSNYKKGRYFNFMLQRLAVSICQRLEEHFAKPLGALAMKFAFDESLNPKLLVIEPRTNSQSNPGRHLEFYRHFTEFAVGMAHKKDELPLAINHSAPKAYRQPPKVGLTFRSLIKEDLIGNVLKGKPEWIDLSIGHGGRKLLEKVCKAGTETFLSFKVGNALGEPGKANRQRIVALEDYVGEGLLRWRETEYMRSIRVPLLEKQLSQAAPFFSESAPDLIWLEDIDLGVRGLTETTLKKELAETFAWFEELCLSRQAGSWGITFFNLKAAASVKLLKLVREITINSPNFHFVAARMKSPEPNTIEEMTGTKLHSVIISDEIDREGMTDDRYKALSILSIY